MEKSDRQKEADNELVVSYLTLRNLIGICGMLLPLVLILATSRSDTDKLIEPSISEYYYTSSGEVFVVVISSLAVFLLTYTGYSRGDNLWTKLAAIGALGVVFFPTAFSGKHASFSVHTHRNPVPKLMGVEVHLLFAAVFFIAIAIISIFYFTRMDSNTVLNVGDKKTQKGKRNVVYKVCGWLIIGCVVAIGIYFRVPSMQEAAGDFPIVFVLETIAVEAFGFSWLTKGETLWPDNESYMVKLVRAL